MLPVALCPNSLCQSSPPVCLPAPVQPKEREKKKEKKRDEDEEEEEDCIIHHPL